MELKALLDEISAIEFDLKRITNVLYRKEHYGLGLVISVSSHLNENAPANEDFLHQALKNEELRLGERLAKLRDAEGIAKKLLAGLLTD